MSQANLSPEANGLIGQVVGGRYRINALLGEGAMGYVFEAFREDISQRVALKVLQRNHLSKDDFVGRFKREIKATAKLQHPNIITVYDSGFMEDGRAYYAMEYVDGQSLRELIDEQGGRLPVDRVLRIMRQVAAAVGAAHAKDIVHRDLKPGNIMISRRAGQHDFVTVLDFGLAKATSDDSDLTAMGTIIGTPEYMAPEIAQRTVTSPPGDVYAMGCMMWEMLTGAPPFDGPSPMAIVIEQMSSPLPEWPTGCGDVEEPLRQLIARMLAKDPQDRPGNGSAVIGSLELVEAELRGLEAGTPARRRRMTGRNTQQVPVAYRTPQPGVVQLVGSETNEMPRSRRETPHKQASHPRLQDFALREKGEREEPIRPRVQGQRRQPRTTRPHASRPIAKGHVLRQNGRKSALLIATAGPAGVTATLLGYGPDLVVGAHLDIVLPGATGTKFTIPAKIAKQRIDGARGPMFVALELDATAPAFQAYRQAASTWA